MEPVEEMQARADAEIAAAHVPTEAEMRDAKVPTPDTEEELLAYIHGLVDRPHDYGTCVYAMAWAATAAFNYVAHKLGATGFQASCADMAILSQTRDLKWGRVLDYSNLLYPQYCDDEHVQPWRRIVEENREEFAKRAREKLTENEHAAPAVVAHWKWLASLSPEPVSEST